METIRTLMLISKTICFSAKLKKNLCSQANENCPGSILIYKIVHIHTENCHYVSLSLASYPTAWNFRSAFRIIPSPCIYTRWMLTFTALKNQIEQEVFSALEMIHAVLNRFPIFQYRYWPFTNRIMLMGNKWNWEKSNWRIKKCSQQSRTSLWYLWREGAFYGPKLKFRHTSSQWADYGNAARSARLFHAGKFWFKAMLHLMDKETSCYDSSCNLRFPWAFLGCSAEHFKASFLFGLQPVQIKILTITDEQKRICTQSKWINLTKQSSRWMDNSCRSNFWTN